MYPVPSSCLSSLLTSLGLLSCGKRPATSVSCGVALDREKDGASETKGLRARMRAHVRRKVEGLSPWNDVGEQKSSKRRSLQSGNHSSVTSRAHTQPRRLTLGMNCFFTHKQVVRANSAPICLVAAHCRFHSAQATFSLSLPSRDNHHDRHVFRSPGQDHQPSECA